MNDDRYRWRREAFDTIHDIHVAWDDLPRSRMGGLQYRFTEGFYDSDWVRFHRGARKQRHFVLERLL